MARATRRPVAAVAAIAVLLILLLDGCSTAAADPVIEVSPLEARSDEPVAIRVSGLRARSEVVVKIRSIDAKRVGWESSATFTADADGVVDPTVQAPTGGTYTGVDPMGLVTSMRPRQSPPSNQGLRYTWPSKRATFTVTVSTDGRTVAEREVGRTVFSGNDKRRQLALDRDAFIGSYRPAAGNADGRRPAVLLIGGAEGGLPADVLGDALAERGLATLSIAYFDMPGLPKTLNDIPLEYFAPALHWLRKQPGVDPDHVWTMGISRGSEAAQLVAIHYPNLVHGVLATVPASVVVCGFPDCDGPAWTYGSKPLPYTAPGNPDPIEAAAVIPVERIDGPVLAVCGGADRLWPSCRYAEAMMARLDQHGHRDHTLWSYPDAGHGIGGLLPYTPTVPSESGSGSTPAANQQAEADAWPQVIKRLTA